MTPRELHQQLVGDTLSVARHLLPKGKQQGREWVVGSLAGEEGSSLSVHLEGNKAGIWADFAVGDKGDLLDLWQQVRGITFVEMLREVKDYLGVEDPPRFRERSNLFPANPKCTAPDNKMLQWWQNFNVSEKTVSKLKVRQKDNAIVFPYISPDGVLELVKYRDMDQKKFWSNKNPIPCLFGWQAVEDNHRDIVICEGEKDCLTFWEQGIPALSVPKGAGSGGKQDWIEHEYCRMERFDEIYICMDNDRAGQQAVAEIIDRLGRHRCKVIDLKLGTNQYKDPNEAHLDEVSLDTLLSSARILDPEELKRLTDFHSDILDELNPEKQQLLGLKLPWQKTFDGFRLRRSEATIWSGINGHGKSILLSQVMLDLVSQGSRVCIASMEMPASKLGAKMYRQAAGVLQPSSMLTDQVRQLIKDNVFIFNSYGTSKASRILEVFQYARKRYGIAHFVIDSLAKCGFAEDDHSGQKSFVDQISDFALEYDVHVHLVVHVRKGDTEERPPGKFDVKGTGAIIDMASNGWVIWRNKRKERLLLSDDAGVRQEAERDFDTLLYCVKQRETGEEPRYSLWFHPQSCQFLERNNGEPKNYILNDQHD